MSERPWLAGVGLFGASASSSRCGRRSTAILRSGTTPTTSSGPSSATGLMANPAADRFGEIMGASAFYPPLAICTAGALYFAFPVTTLTAQAVMLLFLGVAMLSVYGIGRDRRRSTTGLLAALLPRDRAVRGLFAPEFPARPAPHGDGRPGSLRADPHRGDSRGRDGRRPSGSSGASGSSPKPTFPVYALASAALDSGTGGVERPALAAVRSGSGSPARSPSSSRSRGTARGSSVIPLQFMNRSFKFAEQEGHAPTPARRSPCSSIRPISRRTSGFSRRSVLSEGSWPCAASASIARRPLDRRPRALRAHHADPEQEPALRRCPRSPRRPWWQALGARALPLLVRRLAVGACVVAAALQVSMTAFGLPALPPVPGQSIPYVIAYPPSRADWQHARILEDIARESGGSAGTRVGGSQLRLLLGLELPLRGQAPRPALHDAPGLERHAVRRRLRDRQVGKPRPGLLHRQGAPDHAGRSRQPGSTLARLYPVVGQYTLPDGSRAELRARRDSRSGRREARGTRGAHQPSCARASCRRWCGMPRISGSTSAIARRRSCAARWTRSP